MVPKASVSLTRHTQVLQFKKFTPKSSYCKLYPLLCNKSTPITLKFQLNLSSINYIHKIYILLVCQLFIVAHLSDKVNCLTLHLNKLPNLNATETSSIFAQSEDTSKTSSSTSSASSTSSFGSFSNSAFVKSNPTLKTQFTATSDRENIEPVVDAFLRMHPQKRLHHMNKRDETDDFVSAFGRGIGFFVGEPCMDAQQCNSILINVYCNKSTGKCECSFDYPVNVQNRDCVKAKRLGENCEHHESCKYFDQFSICDPSDFKCRCQENYYSRISDAGIAECVLGVALFSHFEWMPLITITIAIVLLTFLIMAYTLLRRLSKGTTNGHGEHGHSHTFSCTSAPFGQLNQPLVILATSSSSYPNGEITSGLGGHYSHHPRTSHHGHHQHHNERRSTAVASSSHGRCDHIGHKVDHCCSSDNNYLHHHHIQACPGHGQLEHFLHEPYDERNVMVSERRRSESRNSDHEHHHHHHHHHQHHPHVHSHHEAPLNHGLYRSNSSEFLSQVRPFSLAITGTRLANRRWSGSSIRSQSSLPSTFSFRSQSTIRNTTAPATATATAASNHHPIAPVHSILGQDHHLQQVTAAGTSTATSASICPAVDKNSTFHGNLRTSALITAVSRSMPLAVPTTSVSTSTSPVVSRVNKSAMAATLTSTVVSTEATHHQLQQQQQQQQGQQQCQPESHFGSETNCSTFC